MSSTVWLHCHVFAAAVFEITVEEGEKLVRPTDFIKFVQDNDDKVLDREVDDEYFKYWWDSRAQVVLTMYWLSAKIFWNISLHYWHFHMSLGEGVVAVTNKYSQWWDGHVFVTCAWQSI